MKIICVVGARPNFIKISPLLDELRKHRGIESLLVHTGQHYDEGMSKVFFKDLDLPSPDIFLGIGSGSHANQTARIMIEFEKVLAGERPDLVVVVGDVNSTLACSLVCAKMPVPVAHVEAGLRSYDRTMPEEINRVVTDALSDYLFTSCEDAGGNLVKEGVPRKKIFFTGNIMIDTLLKYRKKAGVRILNELGLKKNGYALLTLHRPSNVDEKNTFADIADILMEVGHRIPVIFPVHPRTRKNIELFGLAHYFRDCSGRGVHAAEKGVFLVPPMGYLDFLSLMQNSKFVITDSGGIQEETTVLGIPCLTVRENTERPVTVREGTNIIVGRSKKKIREEVGKILAGRVKKGKVPKLWDGKTARRIVKAILKIKTRKEGART